MLRYATLHLCLCFCFFFPPPKCLSSFLNLLVASTHFLRFVFLFP
jgi:hypothetical protein